MNEEMGTEKTALTAVSKHKFFNSSMLCSCVGCDSRFDDAQSLSRLTSSSLSLKQCGPWIRVSLRRIIIEPFNIRNQKFINHR